MLGALDDDGFEHVGCVLCFVGGGFQHFVQFLQLDELNGVFFVFEEIGNGSATDVIGHVLEAVYFVTMLHDVAVLFEQGNALGQFFALQDDESGQLGRDGRRRGDFVHHEAQGRGGYKIEHVVEGGGQTG